MGVRTKILLVVVVVLGLTGLFFLIWPLPPQNTLIDSAPTDTNEVTVTTPVFTPKLAGENKLYLNRLLRFSILYPKNLNITEYGQGNTSTIVFETDDGIKGFQIFVVPYDQPQIVAERFKLDIPSGVMKEAVEVIVGGVRGTMFYSQNTILGETREVWFIHRGFLYEITAKRELDNWLAGIVQTWTFW